MGILRWMGDQMRFPQGWGGRMMCGMLVWQHAGITRWSMELLDVKPRDRVLDIGCGNGVALALLARKATDGAAAGIDPSSVSVEVSTRRNASAIRAGKVTVTQGEAARLPFPDGSFDKVLSLESFYFWDDPVAGLKEAQRVLGPGGSILIVMEIVKDESNPEKNRWVAERMACLLFSDRELVSMLEQCGFVSPTCRVGPNTNWLSVQAIVA
jgi:ubiquinone/menaquinone biosynthesis C-methylase UbiE